MQHGADTTIKNHSGNTPKQDASDQDTEALFKNPIPRFLPSDFAEAVKEAPSYPSSTIPRVVIHPGGAKTLRIVCLSDTHARFTRDIPDGDILIHSGDVSNNGLDHEYDHFNEMMSQCPHPIKILVFGNHDYNVEQLSANDLKKKFPHMTHIIHDQQITVEGIKIYGSSWNGHGMAFYQKHDLEGMRKQFDFPSDTDILITHIPPLLISDLAWVKTKAPEQIIQQRDICHFCGNHHSSFYHWGSRQLLEKVFEKKPKVHQFGHTHDDPQTIMFNGTLFINAALDLAPDVRQWDAVVS